MWNPAPGASGEKPLPLQLLLLLHCHLLHGGLRRRYAPHMALPAAGGHHDLCGPGGVALAGSKVSKSAPERLPQELWSDSTCCPLSLRS